MTIDKFVENSTVRLSLGGRLDTNTSPDLERTLNSVLGFAKELILDFTNLEYVSSAGLRVILKAQKVMNIQGTMKVVHPNETVLSVFDVTGYTNILNIEK